MDKIVMAVCKNNNAFAKSKFKCSHKEALCKYGANSPENTHAEA